MLDSLQTWTKAFASSLSTATCSHLWTLVFTYERTCTRRRMEATPTFQLDRDPIHLNRWFGFTTIRSRSENRGCSADKIYLDPIQIKALVRTCLKSPHNALVHLVCTVLYKCRHTYTHLKFGLVP